MKVTDFILCDDIRDEANNKTSLMGIYNSRINIRTKSRDSIKHPIIMPTLGIYVRISTDKVYDKWRLLVKKGEELVLDHVAKTNQTVEGIIVLRYKVTPFILDETDYIFFVELLEKDTQQVHAIEPYTLEVRVEEIQ